MTQSQLFTPIEVGPVVIPNRILSTGHQTCMAHSGRIGEQMIAYHEARAKGGAGLIVVEAAAVHETANFNAHTIEAFQDGCIDGYRRLAETIHRYETKLFGQLFHPGREVTGYHADGRRPVAYAPSDEPPERFLSHTIALARRQIEDIIMGYATAAARMKSAGLDGVEIVASHGYLPAQFLNPRVNRREDEYGGSFQNRLRFLRRVVESVREHVGGDIAVGLRISGEEISHDGLTADETLAAIQELDALGMLDYFNVIAGSSSDSKGASNIVPPMFIANGYVAPFAGQVKRSVRARVFVGGRINQPQIAERILRNGEADMCAMTRAMITDPDMPNKARAGRLDDIRACIGCNQACAGHANIEAPISCIQFPESGRELDYGTRTYAQTPKRVMIVGGGPAGLKAAAVAAARGHQVVLHEKEAQLGGQARLAQLLPGRAEFGGIITNLSHEARASGAQIVLSSEVAAEMIRAEAPDVVILATGGVPRFRRPEGSEDAHLVTPLQVLSGANVGQSVVVADLRGDWAGIGIAEKLAAEGHHVRYVTSAYIVGASLQHAVREIWIGKLASLGVELRTHYRLAGADAKSAFVQHVASGDFIELEGVDTIVLSAGSQREGSLSDAMADYKGELYEIGDCLTPRTAEEAVFDGLRVASMI